ncbi:hypothetical protein M758_2G018800 [Ceratodon purpureus]|nr:hypothetical protein M758_2G018800 [Ceratodon purpureus]
MENMDVLVMLQGGHGTGVSFRGLEWAWVAVVATIVIAFVSAKRVSIVSVGWTWGAKPGQVRVRVHSFSSMSDGSIVAASGMFSAELLNCSADSCSEDASSSGSDVVSETAGKVAAEMVFIFEKKTPSATLLKQQTVGSRVLCPDKIPRRRTKSLDYQRQDMPALLCRPSPIESTITVPRRAGIEWDALPCSLSVDTLLPSWAQSLTQPLVYTAPPLPSCIVTNTSSSSSQWDPLLRLRIRDSVLCDRYPLNQFYLPVAPVAGKEASIISLKDDVVRLWNSEEKTLMKSVHLPKGYGGSVSAFDANWESKVAALGSKGGLVSVANLESAVYEQSYQTLQPVVQAISLDKSSLTQTIFTGGPGLANPGCSVSLWDSRSSSRQLSVNLTSASNIYGIRSQGNELYVRDAAGSLAAHDVRMLGASNVTRVPCDAKNVSVPENRWWDDAFEVEEKDVEDEFWDCQAADEVKGSSSSYVGSLVMAMSRSFTSKSSSK